MIPAAVRAAFDLRGAEEHLPGGVTGVARVGDAVAKPVSDEAEAAWTQATFAALPMPADVRWPRPRADRDGRFVVDGWIADEFVVDLRPAAPDWATVIELGRRFHAATADVPIPTAMLAARRHRWARAERHAFDEGRCPLPPAIAELDGVLADRGAPDTAPAQLVHVDLTTNVFLAPDGVPVVLDIAPGGRAAAYPGAVVAADALVWHRATPDLVDRVHPDPGRARALLARALRFRLVADQLAVADGSRPADGAGTEPYRRLLERLW